MPPPLLFDLDQIDTQRAIMTREQIYQCLPHRYEFEVLSGICMSNTQERQLVAYAEISEDDWWVRGHLPNRTLLPGALMLEMAGQASAVAAADLVPEGAFLGFGGVDACKFRETVVPPARLYILIQGTEFRPRRVISTAQGVCDGRLVFEASIIGVVVR